MTNGPRVVQNSEIIVYGICVVINRTWLFWGKPVHANIIKAMKCVTKYPHNPRPTGY